MPIKRRLIGSTVGAAVAASVLRHAADAAVPLSQAPSFYRYSVGDMRITAIHDGMAYRGLEGFIPNAPPGAVQQALADNFLPTDRFPITFTTLVVETGGKLVLIDTGNGDM
ncbi:MAG: hypothetical protein ACRYHQ_34905, partial [Janthinobacterium lividum]